MNRLPARIPERARRHARLREALREAMEARPLVLDVLPRNSLWEAAMLHWHARRERERHGEPWSDSKAFAHRLQINFLRHQRSNYERLLGDLQGLHLDARALYILHGLLKAEVLALIARHYPEFREECSRQAVGRKHNYRRAA